MSEPPPPSSSPGSGGRDWACRRPFAVLVDIAASAPGQDGPRQPARDAGGNLTAARIGRSARASPGDLDAIVANRVGR